MSDANDMRTGLTRRQVLVGAATAAVVAAAPAALAKTGRQRRPIPDTEPTTEPVRRYMAASATLPDGRVLICGGYSRPWHQGPPPTPLSSAMLYDPVRDTWEIVAEMQVPRARHAAIVLPDGRVMVSGGVSQTPTDSVEVFDPARNAWLVATPLDAPRYDHTLSLHGSEVLVLGGSSTMTMAGVERYRLGAQTIEED